MRLIGCTLEWETNLLGGEVEKSFVIFSMGRSTVLGMANVYSRWAICESHSDDGDQSVSRIANKTGPEVCR